MRKLSLVLAVLALPLAAGAQAQGMPGATVGLPLGSPNPFGTMTNRQAAPEPAAEPERVRPDGRIGARSSRRLHHGHRHAGPRQRAPTARR